MGALVQYLLCGRVKKKKKLYADDVLLFPHDDVWDLLAVGSLTAVLVMREPYELESA